jgi:hypothetical protein
MKTSESTLDTSVLSHKYHGFRSDQNGPSARREEGAYLNRYVTDEQRSRRPILIATLRAVASWLFFCVALSLRINSDMLVDSASAARTALKNSQLIRQLPDESHVIYGTGH